MPTGRRTTTGPRWRSAAAVLAVGLLAASACTDDDGGDASPSTSVAPTTSAAPSGSPSTSSASTSSAPTSSAPASVPDESSTGPAELTAAIEKIEDKPKYESSDWGYIAIDQETGEVLASQNPDKMFDPGSTMKSFSVSAALDAYGPDHTFVTPVYKAGHRERRHAGRQPRPRRRRRPQLRAARGTRRLPVLRELPGARPQLRERRRPRRRRAARRPARRARRVRPAGQGGRHHHRER